MASLAERPTTGRIPRHFAYLTMRVPDAWVAFAFVLGLSATGLIAETSGAKFAALGYLALTGLAVLLFPHFTIKANLRNALLWLFPIWMLFSISWSTEPDQSLHSVALTYATLLGTCLVGSIPHRRAVGTALFVTLVVFVVYSAVVGRVWRIGSGDMFAGAISRKNQFGHIAAMEIMVSLGLLAWAGTAERRIAVWAMAGALFVGFVSLLASQATGSLLATLIAVGCFCSLLAFRRVALPFRITLIAAIVAVIVLYLAFGQVLEQQVFAAVLQKFGKDTTLTGRTELWTVADRLIAKHPYIGQGPGSFWSINNPDAWIVWREMGVQPNTGFTFHNTFRDILVDYGWIGLSLFVLGIGWHFVRGALGALASGNVVDASRIAMLVYFLIRTPVETITYGALTMDIIPLIGFLCIPVTAGTRWRTPPPDEPQRRGRPPRIDREPALARPRAAVRTTPATVTFRTE